MRARFGLLLLALALAVLALPAAAAGGGTRDAVGFGFRISDTGAAGNESDARVAHGASADRFLAVWCDSRGTDDSRDIYGRLLGSEGRPLGRGIHISDNGATGWEQYPAVAANAVTGQYLVVWQDSRNPDPDDPLGSDIYGRLVSATGVPLGDGLPIATGAGESRNPAVAYDPATGGYLVVWQQWVPGSRDVYGRLLDATGVPAGDAFLISTGGGTTGSPVVAYSPAADQFLVVWARWRGGAYTIRGRGVSGAGEVVGADFFVGTLDSKRSWDPDVAYDPVTDRFLVVWARYDLTPEPHIYGRLVSGDGVPAGEELLISTRRGKNEMEPAVAYNPALGRFLVVWGDGRNGRRGVDIFGCLVSGAGEILDGEFRISGPGGTSDERYPAVASGSTGRFLVVWQDDHLYETRGWDIRGRLVES
ncbi:MAG: hypothetical protein ABIJ48_11975 [Actinomycetota bacterium]